MKYLSEYRSPKIVDQLLRKIHERVRHNWNIMEVCGGQTHSLVKNGLIGLLPPQLSLIHGPGCPVCVTPVSLVDKAISLALRKDVILCSYGDMLRVPGTKLSLLEARSAGADIRILYTPLEAVSIARDNPDKQIVFFAVGFETTAPANALSVMHAAHERLDNYSILSSHVLVPPAMEAILQDPECRVDGFLAAGHVCTIMGIGEYLPIAQRYQVPIVVTGFEPVDLLEGILMTVTQLEKGEYRVENQYSRVVRPEGNPAAISLLEKIFRVSHREWRGLGEIPGSGYGLRENYLQFDAEKKFGLTETAAKQDSPCRSGDIMKGKIRPWQCPAFGKTCTPEHPMGAPMVSSEGACAAYYHFNRQASLNAS